MRSYVRLSGPPYADTARGGLVPLPRRSTLAIGESVFTSAHSSFGELLASCQWQIVNEARSTIKCMQMGTSGGVKRGGG